MKVSKRAELKLQGQPSIPWNSFRGLLPVLCRLADLGGSCSWWGRGALRLAFSSTAPLPCPSRNPVRQGNGTLCCRVLWRVGTYRWCSHTLIQSPFFGVSVDLEPRGIHLVPFICLASRGSRGEPGEVPARHHTSPLGLHRSLDTACARPLPPEAEGGLVWWS